jgi:hypothetical protein
METCPFPLGLRYIRSAQVTFTVYSLALSSYSQQTPPIAPHRPKFSDFQFNFKSKPRLLTWA